MSLVSRTLISTLVLTGMLALAAPAALGSSGEGGGGGGGGSSAGSGSSSSGGGGSGGGGSSGSCNSGYVWNAAAEICQPDKVSKVDDNALYNQGRSQALAGQYKQALVTLGKIKHPDAMTFTMMGFSERKLGNFKLALADYSKALDLEPNNVNTHEYLGEAYFEQGKIDLAKAELAKVKAVCGTTCEQYKDLANFIKGVPGES